MGKVITRQAIIKEVEGATGNNFNLSEIRPTSSNIEVRQYPMRVIAWGLSGEDKVHVRIARVSSVGNANWTMDQFAKCHALEPDIVANVQHMPYKVQRGDKLETVVLTEENPAIHINDAGVYYFEYEGQDEVFIDFYNDTIISK